MPDVAFIALGSNLGDRHAFLRAGREGIARLPRTIVLASSSIDETPAITASDTRQPPYLNQMLAIETGLSAEELLSALHEIENAAGRRRAEKWGARTLDLDIVLFEGHEIRSDGLTIPHPELANREFWQREIEELRALL